MKAVIYNRYGPANVLELTEVDKPEPNNHEVLIRIHATTVSSADWRARSLELPPGFGLFGRLAFGLFKPRKPVLGTELSGVIEAIGKDVTKFNTGDEVFAFPGEKLGCYAEYRTMPEDAPIALKPSNLSHEQAAAISFGGTTALDFLLIKGKVQKGEKVLINGASGAVGSAMVQLANYFGAEVTGVCSTTNLDLVKSLGAHKVIDYTKEDFAKNGKKYDIIADIVANAPWSRVSGSLTEKGRLLLVLASLPEMLRAPFVSRKNGKRCIGGVAHEKTEDLNHLAKLAAQGKFTPLIDRTYPMADIVTAHEYVGQGHKKGNVVITI